MTSRLHYRVAPALAAVSALVIGWSGLAFGDTPMLPADTPGLPSDMAGPADLPPLPSLSNEFQAPALGGAAPAPSAPRGDGGERVIGAAPDAAGGFASLAPSPLDGVYEGTGGESDWRLTLAAAPGGYAGVLSGDVDGATFDAPFEALGHASLLRARAEVAGARHVLTVTRIDEARLTLTLTPIGTDGASDVTASRLVSFERRVDPLGAVAAEAPLRAMPLDIAPPAGGDGAGGGISPQTFLQSYPHWTGLETSRAYDALPSAAQALFSLFAPLQADIAWRLCDPVSAPASDTFLSDAGFDCAGVRAAADDMRRRDVLMQFEAAADEARREALALLACEEETARTRDCVEASRRLAARAAGLESLRQAFSRF